MAVKKKLPGKKHTKRRDADATRARLLEAAMQLFSNLGYEATSTKLIAKKAKVNEALIHRYFESKQGLLVALFHHIKTSEETSALSNPPAASLEEELVQFFRLRNQLAVDREKHMKLILSRAIVDPLLAEQMASRVCGEEKGGMPGLMERMAYWKEKGEISKAAEMETACFGISGYAFMLSFFCQLIFKMPPEEIEDSLKKMAKLLAAGLRNVK